MLSPPQTWVRAAGHDCVTGFKQVRPQRGRLAARAVIPTGAPKETIFTTSAVPLGNDSSLVGAI